MEYIAAAYFIPTALIFFNNCPSRKLVLFDTIAPKYD